MNDVFLSYARADRAQVAPLVDVLEAEGWSVWWDQEIPPGRQWDQVIEEALAKSRVVVVVWSESSVQSRWVRTEAREGLEREILIPTKIDDVAVPLEFKSTQTIDLRGWSQRPGSSAGLDQLKRGLLDRLLRPGSDEIPPRLSEDLGPACSISGVVANYLGPKGQDAKAVLAGVTIDLQEMRTGTTVGTTITDGAGAYRFEALQPGSYRLRAISPANATVLRRMGPNGAIANAAHVVISETHPHGGSTAPSSLPNWDYEAGLGRNLGVADFAFLRTDGAIVGSLSERGIPKGGAMVAVTLLGATEPSPHTMNLESTADGQFAFAGLVEGLYRVRIVQPGWPVVRTCFIRRDALVQEVHFELQ